jgi:magnesium chelatase family protein
VPFLDELPEFKREVLEVMRQPLEDSKLTLSRAAATAGPLSEADPAGRAGSPGPVGFWAVQARENNITPVYFR